MRRHIRAALLMAILTTAAHGATHYVSPAGTATWDRSREPSVPTSLSIANAHVAPGDTVRLLGGTYATAIAPQRSGTSDARILYANQRGATVEIRDADHAIFLDGRSFISVRGIHATHCRQFLIIRAGHHNDIGLCRFEQNATEEVWMGSWVHDSSTFNRIHDCVFSRFGWVQDDDDKGVLLDIGYDVSTTDASKGNVIADNVFAHGGHHSLHICGAHNVVRGNTLHNEAWMPCARPGGCGNRNAMTIGPMARQNLFDGNRFTYAGAPPDDNGANGLVLRSPDNIVRRNLAYANGAAGIALASMTVSVPTGNRIYANAIVHNGYEVAIDSFWTAGVTFGNWGNGPMPGNVLVNNILHGNRDGRALGGYGDRGPQVLRTNWLEQGDPGFVDASLPRDPADIMLPDLRLRSDSPAIDAGEFLTTVARAPAAASVGQGMELYVADAAFFYDGWGIPGELGDRIQLEGDSTVSRILAIDYARNRLTVDRSLSWTAGQGVSLAYAGGAPDLGAMEHRGGAPEKETVLFREDFEDLPDGSSVPEAWWVEGGQRVWIESGRLHMRADPALDEAGAPKVCTVWLDREFAGDLRVEFDAHVIASGRAVNNINLFFLYSDPTGRSLRDTRHGRADAAYGRYHSLDGYIVTFLQDVTNLEQRWPDGTPKARFRLRRCPGFRLLDEGYDYHCRPGVTYHIAMTRRGTQLSYAVDGVVYAEAEDREPLERGLIGLRTFYTELWWDNVVVTALALQR